VNKKVFNFFS